MIHVFDNAEDDYIAWIHANAGGFVANVDRALSFRQYPMVHKATHKLMWSPKIGNFTTGDYTKFCSTNLEDLDRYSRDKYKRPLTYCATCFRR